MEDSKENGSIFGFDFTSYSRQTGRVNRPKGLHFIYFLLPINMRSDSYHSFLGKTRAGYEDFFGALVTRKLFGSSLLYQDAAAVLSLPPLDGSSNQRDIFLPEKFQKAAALLNEDFTGLENPSVDLTSTPIATTTKATSDSIPRTAHNALLNSQLTGQMNLKSIEFDIDVTQVFLNSSGKTSEKFGMPTPKAIGTPKYFTLVSAEEFTNICVTSTTTSIDSKFVWPVNRVLKRALCAIRGVESEVFSILSSSTKINRTIIIEGLSIAASDNFLKVVSDVFNIRRILEVCKDALLCSSSDSTQTALGSCLNDMLAVIDLSCPKDCTLDSITSFYRSTINHRTVLLQLLVTVLPQGTLQDVQSVFESSLHGHPDHICRESLLIFLDKCFWIQYSRAGWELLSYLVESLQEKQLLMLEAEKNLFEGPKLLQSDLISRFMQECLSVQLLVIMVRKVSLPLLRELYAVLFRGMDFNHLPYRPDPHVVDRMIFVSCRKLCFEISRDKYRLAENILSIFLWACSRVHLIDSNLLKILDTSFPPEYLQLPLSSRDAKSLAELLSSNKAYVADLNDKILGKVKKWGNNDSVSVIKNATSTKLVSSTPESQTKYKKEVVNVFISEAAKTVDYPIEAEKKLETESVVYLRSTGLPFIAKQADIDLAKGEVIKRFEHKIRAVELRQLIARWKTNQLENLNSRRRLLLRILSSEAEAWNTEMDPSSVLSNHSSLATVQKAKSRPQKIDESSVDIEALPNGSTKSSTRVAQPPGGYSELYLGDNSISEPVAFKPQIKPLQSPGGNSSINLTHQDADHNDVGNEDLLVSPNPEIPYLKKNSSGDISHMPASTRILHPPGGTSSVTFGIEEMETKETEVLLQKEPEDQTNIVIQELNFADAVDGTYSLGEAETASLRSSTEEMLVPDDFSTFDDQKAGGEEFSSLLSTGNEIEVFDSGISEEKCDNPVSVRLQFDSALSTENSVHHSSLRDLDDLMSGSLQYLQGEESYGMNSSLSAALADMFSLFSDRDSASGSIFAEKYKSHQNFSNLSNIHFMPVLLSRCEVLDQAVLLCFLDNHDVLAHLDCISQLLIISPRSQFISTLGSSIVEHSMISGNFVSNTQNVFEEGGIFWAALSKAKTLCNYSDVKHSNNIRISPPDKIACTFENLSFTYEPPSPLDAVFARADLDLLQAVTRHLLVLSMIQAKARQLWLETMKLNPKDSRYNVEAFLISQSIRRICQGILDYSCDKIRILQSKLRKDISVNVSEGFICLSSAFHNFVQNMYRSLFIRTHGCFPSQTVEIFQNLIDKTNKCVNALLDHFSAEMPSDLYHVKECMRNVSLELEDLLAANVDRSDKENYLILKLFLDFSSRNIYA